MPDPHPRVFDQPTLPEFVPLRVIQQKILAVSRTAFWRARRREEHPFPGPIIIGGARLYSVEAVRRWIAAEAERNAATKAEA